MTFQDFARAHGIDAAHISPSDRIQRVPTIEKPSRKNGAVFWDGRHGWVMDWATGGAIHWYRDENTSAWTEAQRQQWAKDREERRRLRADGYARAAKRAAALIGEAAQDEHGYLRLKGFADSKGLVLPNGSLVVPMRDVCTNALVGAQLIRWITEERRWDKRMLPGMRAKGAVFRIGSKSAAETFLCEGYATGLSVAEAARLLRLNASVLVTFSATNLVEVAGRLDRAAFVVADNDESGVGESAAKRTGLSYCMPPRVGEDANDLHQRAGVFALAQMLMAMRASA